MRIVKRLGSVSCAAATAMLLAAPLAHAQMPASSITASRPPAVVSALLKDLASLEEKLIGLAEAIPESTYSWRPAEGVRSVSEVMMHVAADNYFLTTPAGIAAPAETGIQAGDYPSVQAYENRTVTRAEALQALRDSFVHLRNAMERTDEAFLAKELNLFGMQMSGLDLWVMTTTHLHEHLGQMIAYARSNGVAPPWSR